MQMEIFNDVSNRNEAFDQYVHLINYRYGANKLQKGPKVQLDRSVVEKYFRGEDSEEERRKEAELQRKRKKAAYYNRMANKKWNTQRKPKIDPKVIDSTFDLCEYTCGICGQKCETDVKLLYHVGGAHKDITTGEYRDRFGCGPTKAVEHYCKLCKKGMLHTKEKISYHLKNRHGIGLRVYIEKYLNAAEPTADVGPVGRPRKAYASGSAPAVLEGLLKRKSSGSARSAVLQDGLLNNRQSQSPKKFKCDVCSKSYGYLGALTNHKRKEHNSKRNGKSSWNEVWLRKSSGSARSAVLQEGLLNNRQNQSPKKFKCDVCSKAYAYLAALTNHKRTEHGQGVSGNYQWTNGQWTNARQEENGFDQEVVLLDTDGSSSDSEVEQMRANASKKRKSVEKEKRDGEAGHTGLGNDVELVDLSGRSNTCRQML